MLCLVVLLHNILVTVNQQCVFPVDSYMYIYFDLSYILIILLIIIFTYNKAYKSIPINIINEFPLNYLYYIHKYNNIIIHYMNYNL